MNDLKLQNSKSVDENLRPIQVGEELTSLEVAKSGARVTGNLENTGSMVSGSFISNSDRFRFGTSAGFDQVTATFSSNHITGESGTDDTDIDFRKSNKAYLNATGDINQISFVFPDMSGNFQLTLYHGTSGGVDVANWKSFDHQVTNETALKFAGGSAPTLTNTQDKVDIISLYWDNVNLICYGVGSLNF